MKYLLLSLLAFIAVNCIAQKNQNNTDYASWCVKFSPLGLFEPDQAFSIATEYRPITNVGVQIEGSYIFNSMSMSAQRSVRGTRGFRIVPEIRYYDVNFKKNVQRYVGLQMSYKQVHKEVEEWVYKTNYQQLTTTPLHKTNLTATLIGGLQNNTHRIGYDFNLGLGAKYKIIKGTTSTGSMQFYDNYFGETLSGYYVQLSATFKLVMRL